MTAQENYKKTLIACYLGFVTQAISANFAPLLFITFKNTYEITLDKIGYRTCVVASQVLSAVGLALMAILPETLPVPFIGILVSVINPYSYCTIFSQPPSPVPMVCLTHKKISSDTRSKAFAY